jgi:hypothetical protein
MTSALPDPGLAAASSEAMQTALAVVEARALFACDEHEVCLCVGSHNDGIYTDLCDKRWRTVEIGADSRNIIDNADGPLAAALDLIAGGEK